MKIGFIGIGRMGAAIAGNLLRAGHEVAVYNRSPGKTAALAAKGARVAQTPADVCAGAEMVMTMLADDAAVEAVVFGPDGIAATGPKGIVHISHSTIGTAMARRLAAQHTAGGQGYVSAPVFGRPDAAEAKKLIVVAAGPPELVERCRPLFNAIGRQTTVVGPEAWQANAVKLCGNFMLASMIEAFSEAFATLRKAGVDPHAFLEIMSSFFGSPVYDNYGRIIADEAFEPAGFELKLGLKDVRLMLDTALECQSPMPLASLLRDHLLSALAQGQGGMDWSSVSRVLTRGAGLS